MPNHKKKGKSSRKRNPTVNRTHVVGTSMADGSQSIDIGNKEIDEADISETKFANVEYLATPMKSEYDEMEYRVIQLANGLTALLIAVPSKDEQHQGAICNACVNVGTFSDPLEFPNLALMTSLAIVEEHHTKQKNKDLSPFDRVNTLLAYPKCEETILKLPIVSEKDLRKALGRLAEIFMKPTISRDTMKVVRHEMDIRLSSWVERKSQLYSCFAIPGHPASKYAPKNRIVQRNLTDDTVDEQLIKFRERHYSAHRITVAIKAKLSLDTLEQYAKECFSDVPSNGLPADDFTEFRGIDPFESMKIRRIHIMKTFRNSNCFELTWIIPLMDEDYETKAQPYLFWMLEYKGEGSLFSYLEKKDWCRHVHCNSSDDFIGNNSLYSMLILYLVITEEGHKHARDIVGAVFSYINMLRREGPQKHIFDEMQKMKEHKFRYMHDMQEICNMETFSRRMHLYPPERLITGNNLFLQYNADAIKACTELLTPDRMTIILRERLIEKSEILTLMNGLKTKETSNEIPEEWIQHWRTVEPIPEFYLPKANEFIVENFPVQIYSDAWSEIWYKFESAHFKIDEGYVNLHYISPLVMTSPENVAMLDLFASMLTTNVAFICPKNDVKSDIRPGMKGLWLHVNGSVAMMLPLIIKSITAVIKMCSKTMSEEIFNASKVQQLNEYSSKFADSIELAEDLTKSVIVSVYWSFCDLYEALSLIGFQYFRNFVECFADDIRIQYYAHGNISKADVIKSVQSCSEILNLKTENPSSVLTHGVIEIPQGVHCCRVLSFDRLPSNSAVTNYYQFEDPSFRLTAMIDALSTVMQEFSFNQKHCVVRAIYGTFGYSLTGVDRKDSVEDIDESIETFRKLFRNTFKKMSKKQLQGIKTELALRKRQECVSTEINLEMKVNDNWTEIMSEKYVFDRKSRELEVINEMSIEELRSWMIKFGMGECDTRFRKLSIQVLGYDDTKNVASKKRTKIIGNFKKDIPNIHKLDEYKLKYLDNLSEAKRNSICDTFITHLGDFKYELSVIPLKRFTL